MRRFTALAVLSMLVCAGSADAQSLRPYITGLTIESAPFTNERGTSWDAFSAPDFYPVLVDRGGVTIVNGQTLQDVVPGRLPLRWSFGRGIAVDLDRDIALVLYDADELNRPEVMGGTNYVRARDLEVDIVGQQLSNPDMGAHVSYSMLESQSGIIATLELTWY